MENKTIKAIKSIINKCGEIDIENFEIVILLDMVAGRESSKYNWRVVKVLRENGVLELGPGKSIVAINEESVIIKQDGFEDEYDLVVMEYGYLSEGLLLDILAYLVTIADI